MRTKAVEVKNLSFQFGATPVLSDVSFGISAGEFVSLIGPSGCGKTVLLRLLSGLLKPTGGSFVLGEPSGGLSMAFQKSPLFPWMTIKENILICMNDSSRTSTEKGELVRDFLGRHGLEKFSAHYPHEISGGMQQKVNILRAFLVDANLVLMDEPFVFLDYLQRHSLQDFTLEVWAKKKKTLLFVTHDIDEAIFLSDRILVFSPSPGSLVGELAIPFSRPRSRFEIRKEAAYPGLVKEISDALESV